MNLNRAGVVYVLAAAGLPVLAAPPDKIVIVIEENHSFSQIIGNPSAPYFNTLAQNGLSLQAMYAITHPSQPNYLEFFSGSAQGVTDDSFPTGIPFSTPNLAASLLAAGRGFGGYSEGLPSIGSQIETSGAYRRKHNPWSNWQAAAPGANQLLPAVNMPFTDFPSDFSLLPDVSIVVPDQQHDMHDGTIAQADAWLEANLKPYADWAMTHNSLLVITWDEDAANERNRIPTLLYGPMVRGGVLDTPWTLHDLQRMIADLKGAVSAGAATRCAGIAGAFASERFYSTASFREGENGYAGTQDTYIESAAASTPHDAAAILVADGSPLSQCLIRFDNIVGTGDGQVPPFARVRAAKLMILTGATSGDQSASTMQIHSMVGDWNESSTWNSLVGGISANGAEAAATATFTTIPASANTWTVVDVTRDVQNTIDGAAGSRGWAILPGGTDGWRWRSSETATIGERPQLVVTYTCGADFDGSGFVDIEDYTAFVQTFEAGEDPADFDGSGFVDTDDFDAFVVAFERGC